MTAEALSAPFPGSLRRYQRLLSGYLRPEWPRLALLTLVLAGAIAAQVVAPLLASRFIDNASSGAALRQLAVLSLLAIGVALAGRVLAVAETYVAEQLSWAATNAMRADLLAHLLRLDASFHADHTPGELIERVDGDVSTLARFFSRFLVYVVGNAVLMLGVLGLLVHVDWRIGLALSAFVLLALGVMLRIHVVASRSWAAERQASADFYGFLGEYLAGLEDVRASGAVPFVFRRCAEVMRSWLAVLIRAEMWGYLMVATSWGTFGLATAVALGLCALRYREGTLTIGTVYLVFQYATVLRQPTDQIRHEMQDLQLADASMRRVEALMRTQPRLVDGPAIALPPGRLSLDLDHVWFEYAPGVSVLRDVTVRVETGRVLGIVGRTGSGKTTLTRLLPRFDDPASGAVRLGGVDVRAVRLAALRERLGLVTQEVHLFNASVRDNLTLFDDEVPEERVHAVLAGLGLGDWLASLPRGLETVLGPGGAGVSAGQAQVLACARIFLRDPDVVILDEASSRLDPATERLVHDALGRLIEGRTALIVAHRL
ncbi:MAG TPA: ABC transporter ATP-binding protein, partial [Thermomicrobiaceae bacterium]|nr:ABC transporter ATP-binding protein [Thermomicrobiaceae bacterium]